MALALAIALCMVVAPSAALSLPAARPRSVFRANHVVSTFSPSDMMEKQAETKRETFDEFGNHPNVHNILDVLRDDYPRLFTHEPNFSIFTDDLLVTDPTGVAIAGKPAYRRVFSSLRACRRHVMKNVDLRYSMLYCRSTRTIRVFWNVEITMKLAVGIYLGSGFEGKPLRVDGISVYHINDDGLIYRHSVENLGFQNQWTKSAENVAFDIRAWAEELQRKHKRAWHTGHAAAIDFDVPLRSQMRERGGRS